MNHRIDIYLATVTADDSGAPSRTFRSNPDYESVRCNVQSANTKLTLAYERRGINSVQSVFLVDQEPFNAVSENDRIKFPGSEDNYTVIGLQDFCNQGRVYRIDVTKDVE